MKTHRFGYLTNIIFITLALVLWSFPGAVSAMGGNPSGPDRYELITQDYQSYEWWLSDWSDNQVICSIIVDHEDLPTGSEIFSACGQAAYDAWIATQSCQEVITSTPCSGCKLSLLTGYVSDR